MTYFSFFLLYSGSSKFILIALPLLIFLRYLYLFEIGAPGISDVIPESSGVLGGLLNKDVLSFSKLILPPPSKSFSAPTFGKGGGNCLTSGAARIACNSGPSKISLSL